MSFTKIGERLFSAGRMDRVGELLRVAVQQCRNGQQLGDSEINDALVLDRWQLSTLRVTGFRGVVKPFVWHVPGPGNVVLVHAENGAGKSSLSDALRVALHGGIEHCPSFVHDDLRKQEPLNHGVTSAAVDVELLGDRAHRLWLNWRLRPASDTDTPPVERCTASWSMPGTTESELHVLGSRWAETVAAHRPVISYDELNYHLRDAARLSRFCTEALALGPNWSSLHEYISKRLEIASHAAERWAELRRNVAAELAALDAELTEQHPLVEPPKPVALPDLETDAGSWFARVFGNAVTNDVLAPVRPDLRSRLNEAFADTTDAVASYRRVRNASPLSEAPGETIAGIRQLLATTEGGQDCCPVCATAAGWSGGSHRKARDLQAVDEEFALVSHRMTELARLLGGEVRLALEAAQQLPEIGAEATELAHLVRPLRGRHELRGEQDEAWPLLLKLLASGSFEGRVRRVLDVLISAADVPHYWHRSRARICRQLADFRSDQGDVANSAGSWRAALARLTDVYEQVRDDRVRSLEAEIEAVLRDFLDGTGFTGLQVSITGALGDPERAELSLRFGHRVLSAGALSAGQFNALMLSVLLGSNAAGPFRFLVLDDPVHALDETRIQVLCRHLTRLAEQDRQVVVFTHSERLISELADTIPTATKMALARDGNDQHVLNDVTHPWQALLDQARDLTSGQVLTELTVATLSLGFCRQALDAVAVEVAREWARRHPGPHPVLERIRRSGPTRTTLRSLQELIGRDHPGSKVIQSLLDGGELAHFNAAGHGNVEDLHELSTNEVRHKVKYTEQFCADLVEAVLG
ncbi:hypothetical protein [Saccharopolyspora phatthalungensis]|uniref:Nuclease SbcCD subunit C n=1 Tax=Saccharopolyspora phatthalungensis TaxID=664693 RepID=A0A840Q656_9PSEU|nr:hypothetical protein [Saccharopolyspora phatthalungensis]MBB5154198.1 hypothetical protein [Saccharopolyspora phatthalungensis]